MKIHHIGYAVKNLEASRKEFQELGYQAAGEVAEDVVREVTIQFMKMGDILVELIAPLNDSSHLHGVLKKVGNSPYHICYETDSFEDSINKLRSSGYIISQAPAPAPAIGNRRVAFLFKKDVGIIELVDGNQPSSPTLLPHQEKGVI